MKADLPDKPSELITLALEDLIAVERLPDYTVDMDYWHVPAADMLQDDPDYGDTCTVCFAGSVMAMSCELTRDDHHNRAGFTNEIWNKFFALNDFRVGFVKDGLRKLGINYAEHGLPSQIPLKYYEEDSCQFKRDMIALAVRLEEAGL